jgi:hypothetical protein
MRFNEFANLLMGSKATFFKMTYNEKEMVN